MNHQVLDHFDNASIGHHLQVHVPLCVTLKFDECKNKRQSPIFHHRIFTLNCVLWQGTHGRETKKDYDLNVQEIFSIMVQPNNPSSPPIICCTQNCKLCPSTKWKEFNPFWISKEVDRSYSCINEVTILLLCWCIMSYLPTCRERKHY